MESSLSSRQSALLLHMSARNGDIDGVREALDAGADPSSADSQARCWSVAQGG